MLLGYNFEPRPNSRALAWYSRLSCDPWVINKRMLVFEKASLTREKKKIEDFGLR